MATGGRQVNVREAKMQLSRLLVRVERGEEIVIARRGKPIARLVPFTRRRALRQPGALRGRLHVADDFDAPLPSAVVAAFFGRP